MLHSGGYDPCAKWTVPFNGTGMDYQRAAAAFRFCIAPEDTTSDGVALVFSKWALSHATFGSTNQIRFAYRSQGVRHTASLPYLGRRL